MAKREVAKASPYRVRHIKEGRSGPIYVVERHTIKGVFSYDTLTGTDVSDFWSASWFRSAELAGVVCAWLNKEPSNGKA